MSEHSRLVALNAGRSRPLRCVAAVVAATLFVVLVAAHGTTKADTPRIQCLRGLSSGKFVVSRVAEA
jgi:hypothetical protein